MKKVSILIIIGLIVTAKSQEPPTCTYETDNEGLLTCKLTDGGIFTDNINEVVIVGDPPTGKTLNDVQRLYSLQAASTQMVYVIFNKFVNLKKLELTNGVVEELKPDMLNNCTQLEKLSLNGGSIKTIEANTFIRCTELSEIDLRNNKISSIINGAFNGLSKLKILNFNKNELTNIQANVFNITTLESLDLSKNGLALANRSIFTNTPELLSLNLAENGIKLLVKDHFGGLTKLTELDFTNNALHATQDTALDNLESLQVAKFKSNECIDKDYTTYRKSDFAGDFAVCIQNFNGASILILSNFGLALLILLKLLN